MGSTGPAPAVRAGDSRMLPDGRRCDTGCRGVYLEPRGGDFFTAELLARSCGRISAKQPQFGIHVVAEDRDGRQVDLGRCVGSGFDGAAPPAECVFARLCFYDPLPALSAKEDLWQLARMRRVAYTGPALWKLSAAALATILGVPPGAPPAAVLSASEEARLSRVAELRAEYEAGHPTRVADLKAAMGALSIPVSAGMPRAGMIDALVYEMGGTTGTRDRLPRLDELDEDQRRGVELALAAVEQAAGQGPAAGQAPAAERVLMCAGPGAGKTTTVTNMLAETVRRLPGARVIALVFNVEAESILKKRLARLGVRAGRGLVPKQRALDQDAKGCAVMTFDKLAHQIVAGGAAAGLASSEAAGLLASLQGLALAPLGEASAAGPAASAPVQGTYRDNKEKAAAWLRGHLLPCSWDGVFVDEAQDVTALEGNIVDGLLRRATPAGRPPALVAAGDPRQEVYPGATWYSHLWAGAADTGPGVVRHVLRRNYRSDPAIVAALNAFSRANFPTLHHDQIAVRPAAGGEPAVQVVVVGDGLRGARAALNQQVGEEVGRLLTTAPPGAAYALVPVTLDKFRVVEATTAARQAAHDLAPAEFTLALSGDSKIPAGDAYILATAKRIKGTERSLVVAYALDRDYDVTVDNASLTKQIYVLLSRARDRLRLVTAPLDRQRIKEIMGPFIEAVCAQNGRDARTVVTGEKIARCKALEIFPVPVTGETITGGGGSGVAQVPCRAPDGSLPWTVEESRLPALELGAGAGRADHDFIGVLSEAHIVAAVREAWLAADPGPAREARCPPALPDPAALKVTTDRAPANHGLFWVPDEGLTLRPVLCTTPSNSATLAALLARQQEDGAGAPYVSAMLKFTATCGRPWTVSADLADSALHAQAAAAAAAAAAQLLATLAGLAGTAVAALDPPYAWVHRTGRMRPCRPGRTAAGAADTRFGQAVVAYEPDIVCGGIPVELKHVGALTEEHERQLYSYMCLVGAKAGVLYNARDGRCLLLRAAPGDGHAADFMCRARALLALRTARTAHIRHFSRYAVQPPAALRGGATSTAVFVDVEGDENKQVTEIGAVAVSLTDWSILGTYQRRVPDAVPIADWEADPELRGVRMPRDAQSTQRYHIEKVTGLRRDPRVGLAEAAAASRALRAEFLDWVRQVTPSSPVFLHWGGSERELVGEDAATVDVYRECYMPWLELKAGGGAGEKGRQGSTNLGSAMQHLLPSLPYVAHQAFEDAVATLAMAVATLAVDGRL